MSADEHHDSDSETRALAYALWEQAGRPEGKDQLFWSLAETSRREHDEATAAVPGAQGGPPTA